MSTPAKSPLQLAKDRRRTMLDIVEPKRAELSVAEAQLAEATNWVLTHRYAVEAANAATRAAVNRWVETGDGPKPERVAPVADGSPYTDLTEAEEAKVARGRLVEQVQAELVELNELLNRLNAKVRREAVVIEDKANAKRLVELEELRQKLEPLAQEIYFPEEIYMPISELANGFGPGFNAQPAVRLVRALQAPADPLNTPINFDPTALSRARREERIAAMCRD